MTVADKAEEIYNLLVAVDVADWAKEVTVDIFKLKLDPMAAMESGVQGVFITPVVNNYDLSQSNKRVNVISLKSSPRVAVTLAFPFLTKDSTGIDVSNWEEAKAMIAFREQIEVKIIHGVTKIQDVDAEPAMELSFDKRWYVAMTEFYYDAIQC